MSVIGDVFIFFMLFYGISCRTGVLNFNVVKLTSFIFLKSLCNFFFLYLFILFIFIFGCVGSSLLCVGFL